MKRTYLFIIMMIILILSCSAVVLTACTDDNVDDDITVMISDGEGYIVKGDHIIKGLSVGDECSFDIELEEGYYLHHISNGEYIDGTLTIKDVQYSQSIILQAIKIPSFNSELNNCDMTIEDIEARVKGQLSEGDIIKCIITPNTHKEIVGISINGEEQALPSAPNKPYSMSIKLYGDTVLKVDCLGETKYINVAVSGHGAVHTNAVDGKMRYGDFLWVENVPDRGSIYAGSSVNGVANNSDSYYITVEDDISIKSNFEDKTNILCTYHNNIDGDAKVQTSLLHANSHEYLLNAKDTIFVRAGYTLVGWNTSQDMLGEEHSLGAMITTTDKAIDLYAVWERQNEAGDFVYVDYNARGAKGVEIIGLSESGKAKSKIVLPDTIDNKPVVAIGKRAFYGENNVSTMILKPRLNELKAEAFSNMSSLQHFVMFDDVRYAENDMFRDLPAIKTFYMNSASVRVYDAVFETSAVDKIERVQESTRPKLVTVSGCSLAKACNTNVMYENEFIRGYDVIHTGVHARYGTNFILEAIEDYMNSGDILLLTLENYDELWLEPDEYHKYWVDGKFASGIINRIRVLEGNWDLLREYDFSGVNGTNIMNYLGSFFDGRREYIDRGQPLEVGGLSRYNGINEHGDFTYFKYGNTVDPWPTAKYNHGYYTLFGHNVHLKGAKYYNDCANRLISKGVKVYYMPGPVYRYPAFDDEYDTKQRLEYDKNLRDALTFPVLATTEEVSYPLNYIYDWYNHLSTEGAIIYSRMLSAKIENAVRGGL